MANTGEAGKAPAGVALYDGKTGELIAITVIGLVDVAHTGLASGDGVKATAGNAEKAASPEEAFAVVTEVTTTQSAEILIK